MSFIEERLLDDLSRGFSGGPTWRTRRVTLRSGIQRRNVDRSRPLHRFRGSFDMREKGVVDTLIATFNATRGAAYGFRFRNPYDYEADGTDAFYTAAGGEETIQLMRRYDFGGETLLMPVRKPNAGIQLLASNAPIASSVDTTTGMVTFTASPGDVISWIGTFDIPVFFQNDEFMATIEEWDATTVDVRLEEDLSQ